jgi:succinyl-diaminopimelate desuccinylase
MKVYRMQKDGSAATNINSYIDEHRDELVSLFCDLIRLPSVFPPGEYEALSARMKKELEAAGVRTELICAPKEKVEEAGLEYPRPNVVAMIEGSEKSPVLMLGTHMDVVDIDDPDDWQFDPFGGTVDGGRVWGRGTCDAKSAMAAQVFTAKAIRDLEIRLKGSLLLVSSVDDEGRFDRLKWPGMTFLAEQGLEDAGYPLPDMIINGEASGLENICGSFKGRLILEFEIVGETAHAATPYGINAIDKAVKFIDALKGVELKEGPRQGRESLNVVAVEGVAKSFGDIPNTCKVGLEIRVVAPYSTERMRGEIDRTIGELQKSDPDFRVGNVTVFSDRQTYEIEEDGPLVTSIKEAAKAVGIDADYRPIVGAGELQAFLARGIPGVTYGPGHISRVHRPNEYLTIEELVNQTKIYAIAALNVCGFESG